MIDQYDLPDGGESQFPKSQKLMQSNSPLRKQITRKRKTMNSIRLNTIIMNKEKMESSKNVQQASIHIEENDEAEIIHFEDLNSSINIVINNHENNEEQENHLKPDIKSNLNEMEAEDLLIQLQQEQMKKQQELSQKLEEEEKQYREKQKELQSHRFIRQNSFCTYFLFLDIFRFLMKVQKDVKDPKRVEQKDDQLNLNDLPELEQEKKIENFVQQVNLLIEQQKKLNEKTTENGITNKIILGDQIISIIYYKTFKNQVLINLMIYIIEMICKCSISLVLGNLLKELKNKEIGNAIGQTFLLAFFMISGMLAANHASYKSSQISSISRMILANLMFQKINSMTKQKIEDAGVGKILNIFSADLNNLEGKIVTVLKLFVTPFTLIYVSYILWIRWQSAKGLIPLLIILVVYPLINFLQKKRLFYSRQEKGRIDQRVKSEDEIFNSIKDVKLNCLEQYFKNQIQKQRNDEQESNSMIQMYLHLEKCLLQTSHIWVSLIFFIINYQWINQRSDDQTSVQDMIVTIQVLSFFKGNFLNIFSSCYVNIISIQGSFARIAGVLSIEHQVMKQLVGDNSVDDKNQIQQQQFIVEMKQFTAYYQKPKNINQEKGIINDINIKIDSDELIGVIGESASGKSTFFNSLLCQIPFYSGSINFLGRKDYRSKNQKQIKKILEAQLKFGLVDQENYIFPFSIRENIIFGKEFDEKLFKQVLIATQMEKEIMQLQYGDMTEMIENGSNISIGLKAKIKLFCSIARSLYSLADLYLFDNPFSSFDNIEALSLFESSVLDFIFTLQSNFTRTNPSVLLITTKMCLLEQTDYILVFKKGVIVAKGTFEGIKDKLTQTDKYFFQSNSIKKIEKKKSQSKDNSNKMKNIKFKKKKYKLNLINEEKVQQDSSAVIFKEYLKQWPIYQILGLITINFLAEVLLTFYFRIISFIQDIQERLNTCTILCVFTMISYLIKYVLIILKGFQINQFIHDTAFKSLLRAPLSFYDQVKLGQLMTRLTNDLVLVDSTLSPTISIIFEIISYFLVSIITILVLAPIFSIFALLLFILYAILVHYLRETIVDSREVDLIQRGQLFQITSLTIGGRNFLDAFNYKRKLNEYFIKLCNNNIRSNLIFYESQTFVSMAIEFIGQIATIGGLLLIISINQNNYAEMAQAVLLLTTFNQSQQLLVSNLLILDSLLRSYQRLILLKQTEQEPTNQYVTDLTLKKQHWPTQGEISFVKVNCRLGKSTQNQLKNLNFQIKPQEKIAILGKSGAGKTVLIQTLFRLHSIKSPLQTGIFIDGVNIEDVGLDLLRNSLQILNSEPYLFSGTLRQNLDLFNYRDDEYINKILSELKLLDYIKVNFKDGLQTKIYQDNLPFSIGQQQLICVARTIIRKQKILILDEASALLDDQTDQLIQENIRKYCWNSTVICIPHRLTNIADYDRVMVIEDGQIVEFDKPLLLIVKDPYNSTSIDKKSQFAKMVKQSGKAESILRICKEKYKKEIGV